jgi:hypothetical protein
MRNGLEGWFERKCVCCDKFEEVGEILFIETADEYWKIIRTRELCLCGQPIFTIRIRRNYTCGQVETIMEELTV